MPSKKKKFNSRFPPARIKKIMQTDEEVGKVAAAVPVIISRALEMFIETLILKTGETTQTRNAKTLTATHIKQTIQSEKKFDFLRDLVSTVPDHQAEEEGECSNHSEMKKLKRPRKQKEKTQKRGRKKKSSESSEERSHATNNGNNLACDEAVEEEEDDDEDTETDEDDHTSEFHPADHSLNASSHNSSGMGGHSSGYQSPASSRLGASLMSPISHPSSFVPPYGHLNNMPLPPRGPMMPGNSFVPLMPPFPNTGFPPPVTIDDSNQPLDLCTNSATKNSNSVKTAINTVFPQNSEDDDYDT